MGKKRSSRARRREPVRHPIPQARLHTAAPPQPEIEHLTETDLVDGWSPLPQVRIRQARAEDIDAVTALSRLAGVDIEVEVMDAVRTGIAGTEVRAGLREGGKDGFLRVMAGRFAEYQSADQRQLFAHVTLVLVAEHDEQGVIGALVAYPPLGVVGQMLQHNQRVGGGVKQATQILTMGVLKICRIKSLAVASQVRGHGIGAALLGYCHQVYEHLGYISVYGQAPTTPGLDAFYRRQGFEVLDTGVGFDPWVVFGVHADIRPAPQERIFIWNRPPGRPSRQRPVLGGRLS
ncbi:GNAT family N-acetyltransferase [Micromonospora sp. NPDC049051]|uniref:GNAT family N-acetyltransferase n=1 Tax=Micromonospora sp. NPDC049051 TaxID=3364264 RepID=UPI00371A997A